MVKAPRRNPNRVQLNSGEGERPAGQGLANEKKLQRANAGKNLTCRRKLSNERTGVGEGGGNLQIPRGGETKIGNSRWGGRSILERPYSTQTANSKGAN